MHASIRKYKSNAGKEILIKVQESFVPMITSMPGFIEYRVMYTGTEFISFTVFQNEELAKESNLVAGDWIKENIAPLVEGEVEFYTGEVVVSQSTNRQS